MGFKNFRLGIILRVAVIVASVLILFVLINATEYYVSIALLSMVIIGEVYALIRYAERTNRKITQFLESIRHSDYISTIPSRDEGKSFNDLHKSFNEIIKDFKNTRASEQEHYNYLQTVVQHISIGMIAYQADGEIDLFNDAIKRMFCIQELKNVRELAQVDPDLPQKLLSLKSGDSILAKVFVNERIEQLSINATEFRLRGKSFTLISLQDIHGELEEKEIESWQKLIRVLTHEIMNSITPISSLATTVNELLFDDEGNLLPADEDTVESIQAGLKTINKRSAGLLNFVQLYRSLTRVPKPCFKFFEIKELFSNVEELLKPKTETLNIHCEIKMIPEDLKLLADPDLIEQVIINLMVNAIHAVEKAENPRITLEAFKDFNERVVIRISDNGVGIKPDIMDKIFVPFFTSKKEGSGVGLSLSRQIMRMHKGNISVKSKPGEGATFILSF